MRSHREAAELQPLQPRDASSSRASRPACGSEPPSVPVPSTAWTSASPFHSRGCRSAEQPELCILLLAQPALPSPPALAATLTPWACSRSKPLVAPPAARGVPASPALPRPRHRVTSEGPAYGPALHVPTCPCAPPIKVLALGPAEIFGSKRLPRRRHRPKPPARPASTARGPQWQNPTELLSLPSSLQCDQYKKGIISGSTCKDLCEERGLLFQHCLSSSPTQQVGLCPAGKTTQGMSSSTHQHMSAPHPSPVYLSQIKPQTRSLHLLLSCWLSLVPSPLLQVYSGLWREREVIIKCGIEEALKANNHPDSVPRRDVVLFDKPTRGTSMDEFKEMLLNYLKVSVEGLAHAPPSAAGHRAGLLRIFCKASVGLAEKNFRSHPGIVICKIFVVATLQAATPWLWVAPALGRAYSQAHGWPWQCCHHCSRYAVQGFSCSGGTPALPSLCSYLCLEQPQGW